MTEFGIRVRLKIVILWVRVPPALPKADWSCVHPLANDLENRDKDYYLCKVLKVDTPYKKFILHKSFTGMAKDGLTKKIPILKQNNPM